MSLLAACGGSSRRAANPTTVVTTLGPTTTTTIAPTPVTTAPTTTIAPTTAPTSTDASTTTTTVAPSTTVPAETPEQQVRTAWRGWIAAGEACTVDPKGCDRTALADYMSGKVLANKIAATDELIRKGWRLRTGPGSIEDRYKIEKVEVAGTAANVQFCEYDEGVVDIPGSGPNGEDFVVNDDVGSSRTTATFALGDGARWRLSEIAEDKHEAGRALWDTCVIG
jgi:hypothetical protein